MGFNTDFYSDDAYDASKLLGHGAFPTERIETNAKGGRQSYIGTCFTCIPPSSLERVAIVFEHGRQKYGQDNFKLITSRESIEHAIRHLYKHLEGIDKTENHLSHAAARILMALDAIHDGE